MTYQSYKVLQELREHRAFSAWKVGIVHEVSYKPTCEIALGMFLNLKEMYILTFLNLTYIMFY